LVARNQAARYYPPREQRRECQHPEPSSRRPAYRRNPHQKHADCKACPVFHVELKHLGQFAGRVESEEECHHEGGEQEVADHQHSDDTQYLSQPHHSSSERLRRRGALTCLVTTGTPPGHRLTRRTRPATARPAPGTPPCPDWG